MALRTGITPDQWLDMGDTAVLTAMELIEEENEEAGR